MKDLRTLLKDDKRNEKMFVKQCDMVLDYSRHQVTNDTMELLLDLAKKTGFLAKREKMFKGEHINETEGRAVLHVALRACGKSYYSNNVNVTTQVKAELNNIKTFSDKVRAGTEKGKSGKTLVNVVCIGIGGSCLGTEAVYEALKTNVEADKAAQGRKLIFLANVDPIDVKRALQDLDPAETLVVVVSKTFTTRETMLNAKTAKHWLEKDGKANVSQHMVAVSTAKDKTKEFGIKPENVFGFWDWVGGRFSVWSAVGALPLSLQYGSKIFDDFLAGGHAMDEHFRTAEDHSNLPLLMGLLSVWNSSVMSHAGCAILPYCQAMIRFVAHIQQLDMESNGKRVHMDGTETIRDTGAIYLGEPGGPGLYQTLPQSSKRTVPAHFIGFKKPQAVCLKHDKHPREPFSDADRMAHHDQMMSNFFSQPDLLALGHTKDWHGPAKEIGSNDAPDESQVAIGEDPNLRPLKTQHKEYAEFPGNKPSLSLLMKECNARSIGQLIALYEHRTAVQGWVWDINSFDQWGVELGKAGATGISSFLGNWKQGGIPPVIPPTNRLLNKYLGRKDPQPAKGTECEGCKAMVPKTFWCVECEKELCRRCVGRLHIPEDKKGRLHTIEDIDKKRKAAHTEVGAAMNLGLIIWLGYLLYSYDLAKDYFSGANMCPLVNLVRTFILYLDPNAFIYVKPSLAVACDAEDSFWRLLMDLWVRGICTGRDSLPLIAMTLPMAFLFRKVLAMFVCPVLAAIYATVAVPIQAVLIWTRINRLIRQNSGALNSYVEKVKLKTKAILLDGMEGSTVVFKCWYLSCALRVAARLVHRRNPQIYGFVSGGLKLVAGDYWLNVESAMPEVNMWMIGFEPFLYFTVMKMLEAEHKKTQKRLAVQYDKEKKVWKKVKTGKNAPPLTMRRQRPFHSWTDEYAYRLNRFERQKKTYQKAAADLLSMLVDDLFWAVLAVRVLLLVANYYLNISDWIRYVAHEIGFAPVRNTFDWFYQYSGYSATPTWFSLNQYPSDWLFSKVIGLGEGVGTEAVYEAYQNIDDEFLYLVYNWSSIFTPQLIMSALLELFWRAFVAWKVYKAITWWKKYNDKQKKSFEAQWTCACKDKKEVVWQKCQYTVKSPEPWKHGNYALYMQMYGSFWDTVHHKHWIPVQKAEACDIAHPGGNFYEERPYPWALSRFPAYKDFLASARAWKW